MQRGVLLESILSVDVGTSSCEESYTSCVAVSSGSMEGCISSVIYCIHIRSSRNEQFHAIRVSITCGKHQGRVA